MCKILTVTGIKAKPGVLKEFIEAAFPIITEHDNHGAGYIATDGKEIFTERWLDVKQAVVQRTYYPNTAQDAILALRGVVDASPTYSSHGTVDKSFNTVKAIAMHARYSTNTISLANTHPFTALGVSLIHNGVINNDKDWKKQLSTCDSEAILTAYLKSKVNEQTSNIQLLFDKLQGYYGCALMHTNIDGDVMLDVFRDHRATLTFSIIPELGDAWVWTTDHTQLETICDNLGWQPPMAFTFDSYVLARMNVTTGQVSEVFKGTKPVLAVVPDYLTEAWKDTSEGYRDEYKGKWDKHEAECSTETTDESDDAEYLRYWERTRGHKNRK